MVSCFSLSFLNFKTVGLFSCSAVVDVDVGGNKIGNIEETGGMHSIHEGGMFI